MPTWAARYVRLADPAQDLARLKTRVDAGAQLHHDGKSPFAVWSVPTPTFAPDDLSALSNDFGEALAIAVQTVADLTVYDHFAKGRAVRRLTFAGEAGWVRVLGDPEPWEAQALFSAVKLAELLDELESDLSEEELAKEKDDLEGLWGAAKLEEGRSRPHAEPLAMARAIEKHFGLPARPAK